MDLKPEPDLDWPERYGLAVIGDDGDFSAGRALGATHAIACVGAPAERRRMTERLRQAGFDGFDAIHPAAAIATTARLGRGCIVNAGAVIQPLASVGEGCMVHANVVVEHDAVVGDFVNLSPGCALAGWVNVGDEAVIGTGASIIPTRRIGRCATVGAGAAVIRDVADGETVGGAPARPLHRDS